MNSAQLEASVAELDMVRDVFCGYWDRVGRGGSRCQGWRRYGVTQFITAVKLRGDPEDTRLLSYCPDVVLYNGSSPLSARRS